MSEGFRASGSLSVILITYVKPLDAVDEQMAAHVEWLEANFAAERFIVAGRRKPRTGGVIIARGHPPEIEALAATDPFVTSGVATIEVVAFNASFAVPPLAAVIE